MAAKADRVVTNTGDAAVAKRKSFLFRLEQAGLFLIIVIPLVLTFYAAFMLTSGRLSWLYPCWAILTASFLNLGTTAGYHRMLTHQSFQARPVIQYSLLIMGAMAGMGSPVNWAHKHIHHHTHSDTDIDVHTPHTSRFHGRRFESLRQWTDAHMGWMFRNEQVRVGAKAREVTNTPAARFVARTHAFWFFGGLFLPLCFSWNAFVWLGAVRLFLNHHITWSVNSICHMWGKQPFKNTRDKSKNNALVGILAMGEGWHNNHHYRPTSARHGFLPGQLDLTYSLIRLLERCKLVTKVQRFAACPSCGSWQLVIPNRSFACSHCRLAA